MNKLTCWFSSTSLLLFLALQGIAQTTSPGTWMADNGNGTFSNPLFYEEFSDPDMIRVGDDYYLTGTTMHTMPGLPILHSKDLVNWELLTYAVHRLDIGPQARLEDKKEMYGQGIWAPSFRYHNQRFYIFTNVNGQSTQVFSANDPAGPWIQQSMKVGLHDLSVLFDDDGKTYVVWGYDELHLAQLTDDLLDIIPGTEKIIVEKGSGAGEGCHFYKINGKYFITNTNYDPQCYQVCLRADQPYGPYEIKVMSANENLGVGTSYRIWTPNQGPPFDIIPGKLNQVGCIPMHQGGIVQVQSSEWWGWSMLDYNSLGRVTALSPVTWQDGWPHFGLPGNLNRSPRIWVKPNTGLSSKRGAPFERNDLFDGPALKNAWQWNHVPVDNKWSLNARKGYLRLNSLPAESFWWAKNSLTQRAIGPESYATTELDATNLQSGDIAGLALLNLPYAWLGVVKTKSGSVLRVFDQQLQKSVDAQLNQQQVWLRLHCNFDDDLAQFSYSLDGKTFLDIGDKMIMPYQLKTFQGVRYTLFNYNTEGKEGGAADFNYFQVDEPRNKGLTQPIPYGQVISLYSVADSSALVNWRNNLRSVSASNAVAKGGIFRVLDRGNGRIALQEVATGRFVTVKGAGGLAEVRLEVQDNGDASTFQWVDMLRGDIMFLSLQTHRYLFCPPNLEELCTANSEGTTPDRHDGTCFFWKKVE
ncbi:MAG: family 43 glycosylhydrolase [Bacteroidetes bacterium]|nr:family 43 glycosylhydrolase [Bacteroidota bacterium]